MPASSTATADNGGQTIIFAGTLTQAVAVAARQSSGSGSGGRTDDATERARGRGLSRMQPPP